MFNYIQKRNGYTSLINTSRSKTNNKYQDTVIKYNNNNQLPTKVFKEIRKLLFMKHYADLLRERAIPKCPGVVVIAMFHLSQGSNFQLFCLITVTEFHLQSSAI